MRQAEVRRLIRECIAADRVVVKEHFRERMSQRGLFWGDVLGLLETPTGTRSGGKDGMGRERWFLAGRIPRVGQAEALCVIDTDGPVTIFVTIYWED